MLHDLLMPKLGLTMTEGLLAEWRVQPGQRFRAGEILAVVETDKIASDLEAATDGVFAEAIVAAGQTVPVGTPIARWSADGIVAPAPAPSLALAAGAEPARVLATPLARRMARELGVALASVTGTGPRGRVKAADVEAAAQALQAAAPTAANAEHVTAAVPESAPAAAGVSGARIAPSSLQAAMARRMVAAKRDVPHFYLAAEAELSELLSLRERLNAEGDLPRLSLTHFVLAAVGRALRAMPEMDRVWDGDAIVALGRGDIGLAVSTERGLVAPVLRGAAHLTLDGLAAAASALTERARTGRLTEAEMTGGAITVSNAGMHNVTYMTAVIPPGQAMILGVGSVREVFRPDAAGAPMLKRELGLVLSADHRILDGVTALSFLNRIMAELQRPLRLLRAG